jgi:hypothetical protein
LICVKPPPTDKDYIFFLIDISTVISYRLLESLFTKKEGSSLSALDAFAKYQDTNGQSKMPVFGKMMAETFGCSKERKMIGGNRIYPLQVLDYHTLNK